MQTIRNMITLSYLVAGLVVLLLTGLHLCGQHSIDSCMLAAPLLVPALAQLGIETSVLLVDLSIATARWVDRREALRRRSQQLQKAPPKRRTMPR